MHLPLKMVAGKVEAYIKGRNWRLVVERSDEKTCMFRVSTEDLENGRMPGNGPRLIEWWLSKGTGETTVMETRFGLHFRTRRWFWSVMVALSGIFFVSYFAGGKMSAAAANFFPLDRTAFYWAETILLCIAFTFLLACFIWAYVGINSNYRNVHVIEDLCARLSRFQPSFEQDLIKSDYLFPDIFLVLLFFVMGATGIAILEIGDINTAYLRFADLWPILLLLCILMAFVFLSFVYRGFSERLTFILMSLVLLLPVLIIYGLPHINLMAFPQELHAELEAMRAETFGSLSWMFRDYPEPTRQISMLLVAGNLVALAVAFVFLLGAAKLTERFIRLRNSAFFTASQQSIYRRALDFGSFSTAFVVSITVFWLIMVIMLYFVLYSTFSIFEWGLCGQNCLFVSLAGRTFIELFLLIGGVFFQQHQLDSWMTGIARSAMVIYSGPLLFVVFISVYLRLSGWVRLSLFVRKRLVEKRPDALSVLADRCHRIARKTGVRRIRIVATGQNLPAINSRYVGFPYFCRTLWISRGCEQLTFGEMEGLAAHEMFHLKKHVGRWYLLHLISDLTLFGTGFLAVLVNSYRNELDADRYAVKWLVTQGIPVSDYIRALQMVSMAASIQGRTDGPPLAAIPGNGGGKISPNSPKRWRLLFHLYFGQTVPSYIHPPLDVRIAKIESMAAKLS